jgi:phosphoribosylformylglycinamidine (FGAM) synthase PurS component
MQLKLNGKLLLLLLTCLLWEKVFATEGEDYFPADYASLFQTKIILRHETPFLDEVAKYHIYSDNNRFYTNSTEYGEISLSTHYATGKALTFYSDLNSSISASLGAIYRFNAQFAVSGAVKSFYNEDEVNFGCNISSVYKAQRWLYFKGFAEPIFDQGEEELIVSSKIETMLRFKHDIDVSFGYEKFFEERVFGELDIGITDNVSFNTKLKHNTTELDVDKINYYAGFEIRFGRTNLRNMGKTVSGNYGIDTEMGILLGSEKLPIEIPQPEIPYVDLNYDTDYLVMAMEMDKFEVTETEYTIQAGDNLKSISNRLPLNTDPFFENNVKAIADYNNISNPSKIKVGQILKFPAVVSQKDEFKISSKDSLLVNELLNTLYTSDLVQVSINKAYWIYKLESGNEMGRALPKRGGFDSAFLLNAKGISAVYKQDYQRAVEYFTKANALNPNSKVIKNNLCQSLYLNQQIDEAKLIYLELKLEDKQAEYLDEIFEKDIKP